MANDLRVDLKLGTEEYDRNIRKSKKQLDDWRSNVSAQSDQISSSLGNVVQTAGKMFVAFMAFDKIKDFGKDIIDSSQKTGDAFQNNVNAMTSSYEAFCTALATSDFSAFEGGLIGVYNRALELSSLLDSIADAQMAVNYSSSVYAVELKKNENISRDKTKSKEEQKAAIERNKAIIEKENADRMRVADEGRNAAIQNAGLQGITGLTKDDFDLYLRELNNDFVNSKFVKQNEFMKNYSDKYSEAEAELIGWQNRNGISWERQKKFSQEWKPKDEVFIEKFGKDAMFGGNSDKLLAFGKLYNQGDKGRKMLYDYFENYNKELLRYQNQQGTIVRLNNRIGEIDAEGTTKTTKTTTENTPKGKVSIYVDIEGEDVYDMTNLDASWEGMMANKEYNYKNGASQSLLNSDSFKAMSEAYVPEDLPDVQSIDITDQIGQFQSLGYAISGVASSLDDGSSRWVSYGANIISSVAAALPALNTLLAANTAVAGSGAAASAASIPFIGWAMAGVALAGVVASIATLPKFASGGIVPGGSFNGDKIPALLNSGELVLNDRQQNNLFNMIDRGRVNGNSATSGNVEFKIKGDYLVGILNKTNNQKSRV